MAGMGQYLRERARVEQMYTDWLKAISMIPKPYKLLTEDEWLEACAHFGGCAYCGSEDIATRGMFVNFLEGGAYTAWNVIPLCTECSQMNTRIQPNPFRRMNTSLNKNLPKTRGVDKRKTWAIGEYLLPKLEEAMGRNDT